MTDKLYYESSHRKDFEAQVISCEPEGEGYKVVLDKTVFFPEGGGQYADTGILGGVHVLDAQEKDGIIYHYTDGALTPGEIVKGEIDWEKRFESMQQHSGEHIISGIVHGRFGYNNVGFHLGADYCTMDFDGPITKEQLKEIEEEANRIVYKNLNIEILYPTKEELKDLTYRSKIEIEGQVRIVNIPGVDICACCAPHVDRTGEIGNIKLVDMVSYKGGERITMLSGSRALTDHQQKEESVKKISALLCAKDTEVAEAVEKLKEEQEEYNSSLGKVASDFKQISKVENVSVFKELEKNETPLYKFIGIAFSTYIIIQMKDDMYIIDQHAAHERIMYERVKANYYNDKEKDSQLMLLPDIITLTHKEMDIAKENMEMFIKAGFTLEEFGENTIKLTGVPDMCLDLDTKELFLETLDEINTVARTAKQEKEEKFIATVACKAAVKANMALTKEEVDKLMSQLLVLPNPFTCPHGRPTAIKMSKNDIEKKFSRR